MSSILYFAYGSNMYFPRIKERVPSARTLGKAVLHGFTLKWHKISKDGSGKCNIIRVEKDSLSVEGAVFQILRSEKKKLDSAEGLGNGYCETTVDLVMEEGIKIEATTYYATQVDENIQPYTWYKQLVLAGASQNNLTEGYVDTLRAVSALDDPDKNRHERMVEILKTAQE